MSAFKESRDKSRGQGAFLSLVDSKSHDGQDNACVDIDMTMDIVKDFSNEIFSNIEQLNRTPLLLEETSVNCEKPCTKTKLHIEDETKTYGLTKSGGRIKVCEQTNDVKHKAKADIDEETEPVGDKKTLLERRRVSLPEITSLPNKRAIRIR